MSHATFACGAWKCITRSVSIRSRHAGGANEFHDQIRDGLGCFLRDETANSRMSDEAAAGNSVRQAFGGFWTDKWIVITDDDERRAIDLTELDLLHVGVINGARQS